MKKPATLLLLLGGLLFAQAQNPSKKNAPHLEVPSEKATIGISDGHKTTKNLEETEAEAPFKKNLNDSTFFDLKKYAFASRIDSLWQQELLHSNLYDDMQKLVQHKTPEKEISETLSAKTLKARLAKIDAKTPFNVTYNASVENVIHRYLDWDKEKVEQMMALSAYYFPLFEAHLAKYDIPLELKYLAIVESALEPRAKSWVGATGLWQFMFATGKMYGLDVSSYVDERMDPLLATEAACQYLSSLHDMFQDWGLALAAYNAGPGNVARAIRRSGGNKNYWEIRRYLPRETAGYVPAFFATMYLFEYAKEYDLHPKNPQIAHFATDTVHVKQLLTFEHISEVTGIDMKLLAFLNPSYKLNIIPHIEGKNYSLRLPVKEAGLFVANEAAIYGYVKEEIAKKENPLPTNYESSDKIHYRVRSGDVLGNIAEKYGVRVSQIKYWNRLRSSRIRIGQRLTIYPRKPVTNIVANAKSSSKNHAEKYYTVRQGDSLWSISQKFPGITVQNIQKWNDISGTNLKPGMKLKLSKG